MDLTKQLVFAISALGAFNGIILGIYFIAVKRSSQNMLLGFLLLALSIRIGKSVFLFFNPDLPKTFLQIGLSACFLIGPLLHFYLKVFLQKTHKALRSAYVHLAVMFAILLIAGSLFSYARRADLWNQYFVGIIYIQWGVYLMASIKMIVPILWNRENDKSPLSLREQWALSLFFGNLLIYVSYVLAFFNVSYGIYLGGSLFFSLLLYLLLFFLIFHKKRSVLFQSIAGKGTKTNGENGEALKVLERLDLMMRQDQLYKDPSLQLDDYAKLLDVSRHFLSQTLNDHRHKNLPSYINEFRVQEAIRLIQTNEIYTLEGIGYEVGFKSRSSFYSVFKKVTGYTPATFKKQASS